MAADRVEGYANAIFEVAKAEDVLDRVGDELFNISHVLESSEELRKTLTDSAIPPERRQGIVEDLLGQRRVHPLTTALVSFMVAAGRGRDLPEIISRLVERAAAERAHVVAEVRSAVPLDDDQRRRLEKALSSNLGKQVEAKVVVDPSVLGGLSARVGDVVIDGTVRHRLEQMKESIR
jgi:F-type H+-transporting ATPase subunit delta